MSNILVETILGGFDPIRMSYLANGSKNEKKEEVTREATRGYLQVMGYFIFLWYGRFDEKQPQVLLRNSLNLAFLQRFWMMSPNLSKLLK